MNYPVTTPFGQVAGYPLNNGFHNGIDYGYPMGTPVVVNGVTIGLSNNTGSTTGPHLHVGKFVNGVVQNPGVGNGFVFNSAVIFDTGFDNTDGNYVRITGDGALWNYLHLEKVLVTKGQVLKGGDMPTLVDDSNVDLLYKMIHRDDSQITQAMKDASRGKVFVEESQRLFQSEEYKLQDGVLKNPPTPGFTQLNFPVFKQD